MQGNWQENRWRSSWLVWRFALMGLLALGSLFGMGLGFMSLSWPQTDWLPMIEHDVGHDNTETAVSSHTPAIQQTAVLQHTPAQRKHAAFLVARMATNGVPLEQINKRVVETAVRTLPPEPLNSTPLFARMDTAVAAPPASEPLEDAQLIIPSINVVQTIGIVPIVNGEWDVSELGAGVGHLTSTGVEPGGDLAMTFVGHATIPWPQAGAFADLVRLEHGEEIIYRWNGNDYIYEVSRILIVTPDFVEGVFEEDGNMLMLATCSGWGGTELGYTKRMITRAELVRVVPSPVDIKAKLIA